MKKIYFVICLLHLSLISFAQEVLDGDKTYNGKIIYKNDIALEKSFHLGSDNAQTNPYYNAFTRFSIVYDPLNSQFLDFAGTIFTINDQSITFGKFGGGEPRLQLIYQNGTIQSPSNVNPGNMLGRTIFYGYFNGNKKLSEISSTVVSTSGTLPSAKLNFSIRKDGNANPSALDAFLELNPDGNIYLPQTPPTISGTNEVLSRNIQTGAIEKSDILSISSNGKVGIGITNPSYAITLNNDKTISFNEDQINPFGIEGGDHSQTRIIMGSSSGQSSNIAFGVSNGGGYSGFAEKMRINANGDLGIGTISPAYKLDVIGTIRSQEVKVNLNSPAPDYVFEKKYDLKPLSEIQKYIQENMHLPEVPSAKEMETNGINLSEMNMLLLKKVEELTLHLIDLKNENTLLRSDFEEFKRKGK